MDDFSYVVVSSVLHDKAAVNAIFSRYEPFFSGLNGHRIDADRLGPGMAAAGADPLFFFILTGGTEGIVLQLLASLDAFGKKLPVVLLAHPGHNSLPASLEILARIKQEGGKGRVIVIKSPSDEKAREEIGSTAHVYRVLLAMRAAKIGAVGEPSDWLVASSQDPRTVSSAWGTKIEPIPLSALRQKIETLRAEDARGTVAGPADHACADVAGISGPLGDSAESFLRHAQYRRGPTESDMYKSDTIYRALRQIVQENGLDAVTLRCFDLVTLDRSTGCFALSQLADDGIDAGCEGDIPSVIALRWMHLLTDRPAWMANPADISLGGAGSEGRGKGRLLLAHCTVPRTSLAGYGVRSHFESGLGVAIAGSFAQGPVTLVRLGGKALDAAWIAEGSLLESPHEEGLCRTQAVVELGNDDLSKLLENPLGNHLVLAFGHWKKQAERYLDFEGIAEI